MRSDTPAAGGRRDRGFAFPGLRDGRGRAEAAEGDVPRAAQ